MHRRTFVNNALVVGAAAVAGAATQALGQEAAKKTRRIIGVACSPRNGKTTAMSVQVALDEAKKTAPDCEVELIDLGGMEFAGWNGTGKFEDDDFSIKVLPKLRDPAVAGLVIGSPVYFRNMSSLCMAFLERLAVLRSPSMQLSDLPVGAIAVGAYRNGGQELVLQQIQTAMLCQEAMVVGGRAPAFQGATLLNEKDSIQEDALGITSAKRLGQHIAEIAMKR